MIEFLLAVLGADRFSPQSSCLLDDELMIFFYTLGHVVSAAAYIVLGLVLFTRRFRPLLVQPYARGLFGAVALLCGVKQITEGTLMFVGIYRLDVLVVAALAATSVVAVLVTTRDFLEQSR